MTTSLLWLLQMDSPTCGRPVFHETGSGTMWRDLLRPEFQSQFLDNELAFGCLDAPQSIAAGSVIRSRADPSAVIAEFHFR